MKVMNLQQQIERGEYEVNAHAVADAIVRRLLAQRGSASAGDTRHP